jgi:hypothetical protein
VITYRHYEWDTLPRVRTATESATTAKVYLPVRVDVDPNVTVIPAVTARWGDHQVALGPQASVDGRIVRVGRRFLQGLGRRPRGHAGEPYMREYLAMRDGLEQRACQYYEARLHRVPVGAEVAYGFSFRADGYAPPTADETAATPYSLYASNPIWSYEDLIAMHTPASLRGEFSWALYHKEAHGLQHVRVDLSDVEDRLRSLRLTLGRRDVDFAAMSEMDRGLPLVDRGNDYVVISLPAEEEISPVTVRNDIPEYGTEEVHVEDLHQAHETPKHVGTANVMLIQFCIQALNDLFEAPVHTSEELHAAPSTWKTYMQITMRDLKATYSSRPESEENGEEDGYALTFAAQRRFRLPYLCTFNAGVLAMLAHDCPHDLEKLRKDIAQGLLDPTVVGFAGHRLSYFQPRTNEYVIDLGVRMMRRYLGREVGGRWQDGANDVFFPDSRFYRADTDRQPLKDAGMRYLVVDAETTLELDTYRRTANPPVGSLVNDRYLDHQYLWQDWTSGLYLLMIQGDLRDGMFAHTPKEYEQGKLPLQLRRKLLGYAATPVRRDNLLVYADDLDKCAGNGWFDGNYAGTNIRFNDRWQASIEWMRAHPWVRFVTSHDLEGSPTPPRDGMPAIPCVGTFDLGSAIDPSVDPQGIESTDSWGKPLHFDAWYDAWKNYRTPWLDQTLEEISQEAEFAVLDWPEPYRDQTRLLELAQMSFASVTHELPWNKQPLEQNDPNRTDPLDPEDFVIVAGLQVRNTHVHLAATVWADWASRARSDRTARIGSGSFCNGGPVPYELTGLRYAADNPIPALRGSPLQADGLYWDHDLLPNVILYNKEALVVLDRNGGRITHIFCMLDGEPRCVSGTFKTYQFKRAARVRGELLDCDGPVLQNTVFTPNHAYVATDVIQSHGIQGTYQDPRSEEPRPWWYPDNFNVYEDGMIGGDGERSVEFLYRPGTPPPPTIGLQEFNALLARDRRARLGSGEAPVVWHDPAFGSFDKKVTLDGRVLTVSYTGVQPGHLVANEFCVDLWTAMMEGALLSRHVGQSGGTITMPAIGATVTVEPGPGCTFSHDTGATMHDRSDRYLRGHRVLTDRLDLVCPAGGSFSYTIALP